MDLISRQAAIDSIVNTVSRVGLHDNSEVARYGAAFRQHEIIDIIEALPSAEPEVIRCKDCKHQEKFFHADRRRKDGGYYICGCELAEGYSHVCLDDDFCSRAERRSHETD